MREAERSKRGENEDLDGKAGRVPRVAGRSAIGGALACLVAVLGAACDAESPVEIEPRTDSIPGPPAAPSDSLFGVWEAGPTMPEPRMRHAAIVYRGDLIVVGGIVGPGTFAASVIRLAPGATEWVELAPMPMRLAGLSLAVTRDTLFAVAGDGPLLLRPEQALFAYDPTADVWHTRRNVPDWRTFAEAATIDDILWLTGGPVKGRTTGEHGGQPPIRGDTILEYTPGADAWAFGVALPTPRMDHEVVQVGDLTYLVGGEHGAWPRIFPDIEVYDPATGDWWSIPDPYSTRRIAAAYAEPYIHVVGGDEFRDHHRALDTRTDTWVGLPPIPYALEWPKLVRWDGAVWLIGGLRTTEDGGRTLVDEVFRFQPEG